MSLISALIRKPMGMQTALRQAGLPLQGIHHRGIDNARNIARLLPYLVPHFQRSSSFYLPQDND